MIAQLSKSVRQYMLVTFNYWNFTLTDGALRMLVVLYFHDLGYSALAIASLFLFYEFFGVVTNLIGGWLGARLGLNKTMNIGLAMQIIALLMLAVPAAWLTIPWVMAAQALSGIAKDLNKMSAKSAIKTLVPDEQQGALFKWVAILTGSKNALKGAGFFLGGLLLAVLGFQYAVLVMAGVLTLVLIGSLVSLESEMGKAKNKPKFNEIFSKSAPVNILSGSPLSLWCARCLVCGGTARLPWQRIWLGSSLGRRLSCLMGHGVWRCARHRAAHYREGARSSAGWSQCFLLGRVIGIANRSHCLCGATSVASSASDRDWPVAIWGGVCD